MTTSRNSWVELRKVARKVASGVSSGPISNGRFVGYKLDMIPWSVEKSLPTVVGGYWLPKLSSFPSSNPETASP